MSRIVKYRGIVHHPAGYDEYTKALLHFDESVTKDECGNTWEIVLNSPTLSDNGKFGKCLATFNEINANKRIACSDLSFDISKAPLCIDFWTRPYSSSNPAFGAMWLRTNVANVSFGIRTGTSFSFIYYNSNVSIYAGVDEAFFSASVGTWYHLALVITSTYIKAYVNGVLQITKSYTSDITNLTLNYIMTPYNDLDEFRISYGIARWTENFTPPTAPYAPLEAYDSEGVNNVKFYDFPAAKPNIALNSTGGAHTYAGLVLPTDSLASDILVHTVDGVKAIAKCKKTPTLTFSKDTVNLYREGNFNYVTYETDSEGEVSISTSIAPKLTSYNFYPESNKVSLYNDKETTETTESFTVTITVAESREYEAISKSFTVNSYRWGALSEHTPAQIQQAAKLGIAPLLWSVGDMTSGISIAKTTLGTYGGVTQYINAGTYYAKILGFNHNSSLEGNNTIHFALATTSNGTDIAFVEASIYGNAYASSSGYKGELVHKRSNTASNANGWSGSYIKSTMLPRILANIDSSWTNVMAYATKYTDNVGNKSTAASSVTATSDKLFIPSYYEVQGDVLNSNPEEANKQQQYDYFKLQKIRFKHNATSTTCVWWTRSAAARNSTNYKSISTSGGDYGNRANYSVGVVPCFVIG